MKTVFFQKESQKRLSPARRKQLSPFTLLPTSTPILQTPANLGEGGVNMLEWIVYKAFLLHTFYRLRLAIFIGLDSCNTKYWDNNLTNFDSVMTCQDNF